MLLFAKRVGGISPYPGVILDDCESDSPREIRLLRAEAILHHGSCTVNCSLVDFYVTICDDIDNCP